MLRPCRFGSASTSCSRPDLPGVFQPGALMGFSLQSLTRQGSLSPLGAASPLAIGNAASRYRTALPLGGTRLPGGRYLAPSPFGFSAWVRWSSGVPDGIPCVPDHRRPVVIAAAVRTAGPARPRCRGFLPLSRWDIDSASLRSVGILALLGFLLPGALPFPALAWSVVALAAHPSAPTLATTPGSQPRRRVCARTRSSPVRPPLRYFRQVPFRVRYPVLQSFQ